VLFFGLFSVTLPPGKGLIVLFFDLFLLFLGLFSVASPPGNFSANALGDTPFTSGTASPMT